MDDIKKFQFLRKKLLECEGLTLSEVYFILFYDPPLKTAKTIWKEKYILPTTTKNISFKTKFDDAFIGQKKTSKSKPLVYIYDDFVYKGPYVNSTDKLRLMMFRRDFLTLLGDTTPEIKLYQVDDEIYVRMPYIGNSTEWKTETSKIIGEDKPRKIVTKESQGIEELLPYMKRVDNPDTKIIYKALIHYIHRVICDPVIGDPALRNILIVNNDIVCIDFEDNRGSIDYTLSIFELLGGKANWATKDILEKFKKVLDEKKSKIINHLNSINLDEIKEMIETHMIADLVNIDNIKTNIVTMKKKLLDLNETVVAFNPKESKVDENKMTYKHNNSISRHGHSQDALLSALQKYIRRGETEKAQYVGIELFLFNELPEAKALVTRAINRLRVILPEDTSGISSPKLTILFNKYYERSFSGVLSMIYLLSNAPKIRLISDIKMVFFSDMDKTDFPY